MVWFSFKLENEPIRSQVTHQIVKSKRALLLYRVLLYSSDCLVNAN